MKLTKPFFLSLIVVATSFDVLAEKIYKTVDESGAVVFSDVKTPDAEKIKVKPNVVEVRTPDMPEPIKPTVKKKPKQASTKPKEVVQGGGSASGANLRRKIRNVAGGEGTKRPVHLPARTPPANQPAQLPSGPRPGGRR